MDIVFDLDGVLVDTRDMIRQAYLQAGVVCPDDALGQEGTGWLKLAVGTDAENVYRRKNRAYMRMIQDDAMAPLLPPFATAYRLSITGDWVLDRSAPEPFAPFRVHTLSAAPRGTFSRLRYRLITWPFTTTCDGMSTDQKMTQLDKIAEHGVYIDDQAKHVNVPDGWSFIHYIGQSADQLYEEVMRCNCA